MLIVYTLQLYTELKITQFLFNKIVFIFYYIDNNIRLLLLLFVLLLLLYYMSYIFYYITHCDAE